MSVIRRQALFLFVALNLLACAKAAREPLPMEAEMAVREAKRAGQDHASISSGESAGVQELTFEKAFAHMSVVVATVSETKVALTGAGFRVWHKLKMGRSLAKPAQPGPGPCSAALPSRLKIGPDEVAVEILGATQTVEGIRVVWDTPESTIPFEKGRSLVLIGTRCANGHFFLPWGVFSVFELGEDGRIKKSSWHGEGEPPFVADLTALRSMDELAARIGKLQLGSSP